MATKTSPTTAPSPTGHSATGDRRPTPKPQAPSPAPDTKAPKVKVPSRKQEMARQMADAIAQAAASFSPDEKQAAANMIHHFPTGKLDNGQRYWPQGLPRPARSDWA